LHNSCRFSRRHFLWFTNSVVFSMFSQFRYFLSEYYRNSINRYKRRKKD
jgi:hypothetical protein